MTYQVFLRNEYVRDAQGYLRMQLPQTDNEDVFDDKHENGWSDVSGDMLLMELHDTTYQDVVNRLQTLYSNADFKVFRIESVTPTEDKSATIDLNSSLSDIINYCKNKKERHASCMQCPLRKSYSTKQPDCCLLHMIERPSDFTLPRND